MGNLDKERVANYIYEYNKFIELCNQRDYCKDKKLWLTEIGFTKNSKSPCGKSDSAAAACLQEIYDGTNGFAEVERWAMYAGDSRYADLSEGNGAGPKTKMGEVFKNLR